MKLMKYPCAEAGAAPRLIALGFFDGVHRGHRALLARARAEARRRGLTFSVFTFSSASMGPKGEARLYSDGAKAELLAELGADELIMADFAELSHLSPADFAVRVLIGDLACRVAVSGRDYRFGEGARGDAPLLAELLAERGADFIAVPEERAGGKKISTTAIKELIAAGQMGEAANLLGAPFHIEGRVERGLGIAHGLGMPTVNTSLHSDHMFLKSGVYASVIKLDGKFYTGLTNIGTCPTFGAREVHAETHVLDFSEELYGRFLKIYLLEYLREERVFESAAALTEQVARDREAALAAHAAFMEAHATNTNR